MNLQDGIKIAVTTSREWLETAENNTVSFEHKYLYTIGIKLSIFWYKFSHTRNQANLFYIFRTKQYFDPDIICIYSYNMQMVHLFCIVC